MPITDNQLKLITEEAERHTRSIHGFGNFRLDIMPDDIQDGGGQRIADGYIAAATLYQEKLNLEREKAKVLVDTLEQCKDYLDDKSDVDHDGSGFRPNEAMELMVKINQSLDTYNKAEQLVLI